MFWVWGSGLLFEHFRAAQPVLEAAFLSTLGRHSLFCKLLFEHFRAAQLVLEAGF